jgi:flagellar biosynthesis/type III secretory pathway chaperone
MKRLEQMIRTVLQAKGVQAPDEDYSVLVTQWQSILSLQQQASKAQLKAFDIALCHRVKETTK